MSRIIQILSGFFFWSSDQRSELKGCQNDPCVAENREKKKSTIVPEHVPGSQVIQEEEEEVTKEHQAETLLKNDWKNSKQEEKEATGESCQHEEVKNPLKFAWQLVSVSSWTLSYQINSLVVFDVMTTRHLLASQSGGTYVILMSSDLNQHEMSEEQVQ